MATEYFNDAWRIPNNKNQSLVSNYSMEFDGTNDFVNLGSSAYLNGLQQASFSSWIKFDSVDGGPGNCFLSDMNTSTLGHFGMVVRQPGGRIRLSFYLKRSLNSQVIIDVDPDFFTTEINTWYHVVMVFDGTLSGPSADNLNRAKIYINGQSKTIFNTGSGTPFYLPTNLTNNTSVVNIGKMNDSGNNNATKFFDGQIDQTCIFNYALSASQVSTLYGGGTTVTNPMTLSPAPVAYYQLGDQSVDNGANYLVPNNSLNGSEGYSPYALSFDSNNANQLVLNNGNGNGLLNAATSFTISAWINPTQPTGNATIFAHWGGGILIRYASNGTCQMFVTKADGSFTLINSLVSKITFNGDWQNFVATYDGVEIKMYINNALIRTPTAFTSALFNDTTSTMDTIGGRGTEYFNGKMSNVAIWKNSVINVTTLYNQGVPGDLTSLNPSGWWQMGGNSSFDTNTSKWTCLNEGTARTPAIPSNATTLTGNMTNDAITNGVGYSGNGLGTSSIEIVGYAPYSIANGISENMDVLDRTTDVPS